MIDVREFGTSSTPGVDDSAQLEAAVNWAASSKRSDDRSIQLDGPHHISRPIVVPPWVSLYGAGGRRYADEPHATLVAMPEFVGSAMVLFAAPEGGEAYGQQLHGLTLDGRAAKARSSFSGVRANGMVRGVVIRNVTVMNVSDRGFHGVPVNGRGPFSWHVDNAQTIHCGADGFRFTGMTDATFTGCRSIGAKRHGWWVDGCANSTWSQCRSEWSGGEGWNIVGGWGSGTGAGGATFSQCSTDRNGRNGFLVSATGTAPLSFLATMCRRDGRSGGGYSGFAISYSSCPVRFDGDVYPGVDDDGQGMLSPAFGVRIVESTHTRVTGGYLHAAVPYASDDMRDNAISPMVGRATGTTRAPVRHS